jgi:NAD(P)-dependent dehydrogenase (short-subunit alcohol dehydrogenase family)
MPNAMLVGLILHDTNCARRAKSGIGLATALELARLGHHRIGTVRNPTQRGPPDGGRRRRVDTDLIAELDIASNLGVHLNMQRA